MPLMKLACTALERVPLTRTKIIENLMKKLHQDLVFCRSPGDCDLTSGVLGMCSNDFAIVATICKFFVFVEFCLHRGAVACFQFLS